MLVKFKQTGQVGDLPDNEFDPNLYEQLGQSSLAKTSSTPQPQQQQTPMMNQSSYSQGSSPYQDNSIAQPKSLEGFAGNVGKSALSNAKAIGSGLINTLNPDMNKNTIANLGKLGIDTVKLMAGDQSETNKAKQVLSFYKDRYGGLNNIGNTLYNDPVGVALDASAVLGGGSAIAKGAGLGDVANALGKTSEILDPIAQTTKLAGKGLSMAGSKIADATQGTRDASSAYLAEKSIRANPTQLKKFQDITDQKLGSYMSDQGIYTIKDAEGAIAPLQDTYNNMVRTGKKVSGTMYADNLRQKALDIVTNDHSPSARDLADKLWNEAKAQEGLGDVTDSVLANTKSNTFNKVTSKSMLDPLSDSFNKAMGSVGIQTLDQIAPGSAEIGKKLQALREFQDIASKQSGLGRGAQLFNLFNPAAGGAVVGNVIPGIGPIAGAVIGGAATNPTLQRVGSKLLQNGLPASVGNVASKVGNVAGGLGYASRALTPSGADPTGQNTLGQAPSGSPMTVSSQGVQTNQTPATQSSQSQVSVPYNPSVQLSGSQSQGVQSGLGSIPKPINSYGASLQELRQLQGMAIMQGANKQATQLEGLIKLEEANIKDSKAKSAKPLGPTQIRDVNIAKNSLLGLDVVKKELINPTTGNVDMGKINAMRISPGALGYRKLYDAAFDAIGGRLRIETGAAMSPEEIKRYVDNYFLRIGDSPDAVKYQLNNLEQFLVNTRDQQSSVPDYPDTQSYQSDQGLGASPPAL